MSLIIRCWPGFRNLWNDGDIPSLVHALIFSFLINATIATNFLWPEWAPPIFSIGVLVLCGLHGLGCLVGSIGETVGQSQESAGTDQVDLFLQAQAEYLRGHWFEAEATLRQQLLVQPADLESNLMLATLFRHTQRWREAASQLDVLEAMAGSDKWWLEIHQERSRLTNQEEERRSELMESPADSAESDDSTVRSNNKEGSQPALTESENGNDLSRSVSHSESKRESPQSSLATQRAQHRRAA